jgi:outer membrane protein OmpA-like peptidoglycan-associated protein
MSTGTVLAKPARQENWLPILERATQEVFEIMLGCQAPLVAPSEQDPKGGFTAIVGLAGALCGVVTVRCTAKTASQMAKVMTGETPGSEEQSVDAIGEMCNMIAGNFASGSAQMKSTSEAAFDRIASMLRQREYRLRIEGHTDNIPIHTAQFPSNWELSASRATEIVRLLIVRDGFAPDRLSAGGFAEYHPAASNRTPEGRGMNRRVDIVILGSALTEPAVAQAWTPSETKTLPPLSAVPLKPTNVSAPGGRLQQ